MIRLRRRELLLAAGALGALSRRTDAQPQEARRAAASVAVCFGSGSLHGYAHIGAIRSFEKLGFIPQVICGTSVGGSAGALWAAGLNAQAIETIAKDQSWHEACHYRHHGHHLRPHSENSSFDDCIKQMPPIELIPMLFL